MTITTANPITDEQFIAGLKAAVAERGEAYVHSPEACLYVVRTRIDDDPLLTPGCLIGLAVYLASPEAWLDMQEGAAAHVLPDLGVSALVADAAQFAQGAQDSGRPWGEAFERFERCLALEGTE